MTKAELIKQIMREAEADGEPVTEEEAAEMAEMEIKANGIKERVTPEVKTKRKAPSRKPDEEKIALIEKIYNFLLTNGEESATIVIQGKEIDFRNYTLTLTKHSDKTLAKRKAEIAKKQQKTTEGE